MPISPFSILPETKIWQDEHGLEGGFRRKPNQENFRHAGIEDMINHIRIGLYLGKTRRPSRKVELPFGLAACVVLRPFALCGSFSFGGSARRLRRGRVDPAVVG